VVTGCFDALWEQNLNENQHEWSYIQYDLVEINVLLAQSAEYPETAPGEHGCTSNWIFHNSVLAGKVNQVSQSSFTDLTSLSSTPRSDICTAPKHRVTVAVTRQWAIVKYIVLQCNVL
jgi:hypothetical protein